jgi:hypothetical protein
MQLQKGGIRALGIAESFSDRTTSCLCGVVMRRDLHIDGFIFGQITVGGDDSTQEILKMVKSLNRKDINLILLNGCVIAWYNIINPALIYAETGIPVICISYEKSEGLMGHIEHHFPDDFKKLLHYQMLGNRLSVRLSNDLILYARGWGLGEKEVVQCCRMFTHHGKIPEPLRVARLCARSAMNNSMQRIYAVK